MAEQAEAGHVGHGVHALELGELGADRVRLGGRGDERRIALRVQLLLLERGAQHAHAKRLGQDQHVARARRTVPEHPIGVDQAHHRQAVDRLQAVDRVAAGDRHARCGAGRLAALEDLADRLHRQLADRHADDRQRHDRPPAHGPHIGQGVGRGDPAEVERVVDHRHEEVGGGDQRLLLVQLPDRRVVGGLGPHQQVREGAGRRHALEDVLQHRGRQLAAAAAAMGERGQAHGLGHGTNSPKGLRGSRRRILRAMTGSPPFPRFRFRDR
jgi:hypothetical protein